MADGAPWCSPTSWCGCGSDTLPPENIATTISADCKNTSLDISETITPTTTSAAPTNVLGEGGILECNHVLQGDEQGCANVECCNRGGTCVGLLTTIFSRMMSTGYHVGFRICISVAFNKPMIVQYTIRPTENVSLVPPALAWSKIIGCRIQIQFILIES